MLYDYDDPQRRTENKAAQTKLQKKGDIHITIWYDNRGNDENTRVKWAMAIKGDMDDGHHIQFVPMMNQLFNEKITGSHWIKMQNIGK